VKTPAGISEIFDEISYDKGGSILRMLEDFLGEDVFRDGLRKYLSDHKYGNATTQDLWAAFEQVSGKPVKRMMNVWIKQVGYPIVTWEGSELVQGRFMHEGVSDSIWPIPLSIKTDQKRISQLMDKKRIKFDVDGKWVKLNFGQKGYYRVQYTDGMLEKLKGLIENKKLPSVDRWGIENDMYALCAANKMPASKYLEIIKWYWNDDDYLVCHDIEDGLYAIYLLSSKERFWPEVKAYSREYLTHVISRLGWEPGKGEKHTDALLRSSTILQLGRVDDKKALSFASKKFDAFMKDNDSLHADLRGIVYSLTAWQGDRKTYGTLKDLYIKSTTQEEKRRFLSSMSGFRDEKLLLKTLDFSLSPQVRVQDTFVPIAIAAANPYSRDILWPWIKENWGELHERYSVAKNLLGRIIDTVSILADDKKEAEVRKFFEQHPAKGTEMTVRQMLERLKINARFVENLRQSYSV
ncbi:M1 family peptidase, partial [archaeon]